MYLNLPKYPRFLTAAAGSAFMTTGIVLLMVQLVAVDDTGFVEPIIYEPIDIYDVRDEQEPEKKKEKPEPPPKVEVEPTPPPTLSVEDSSRAIEIAFVRPVAGKSIDIDRVALTDGEQIPLVKVAPTYPSRAAKNGIEGYVVLSFTITPSGATADASIIEFHPSEVFNKSALTAVRKFKYKPKVVDGQAQPVYNVQHRLTYELTNG